MHSYCSPSKEDNDITCFDKEALIRIAEEYNKKYPNDAISYNKKKINKSKIWKDIQKKLMRFTPNCSEEYCLLENPILENLKDKNILENSFRPKMPSSWKNKPREWLSTMDIQAVMEQYEKKHTDFKFIGPVPMDFDHRIAVGMCISNELCNINLSRLHNSGIRKIGIIFNLDPHYLGGSHWVSLFLDMNTAGIYFFDSVGKPPPQEVQVLMSRLKNQGNKLILEKKLNIDDIETTHSEKYNFKKVNNRTIKVGGKNNYGKLLDNVICLNNDSLNHVISVEDDIVTLKMPIKCDNCNSFTSKCFKIFYNEKQFQKLDTECGIYSMNFIEEFLKGKQFNQIIAEPKDDSQMFKKRKIYYRP